MVILLLGILTATALPRFMDVTDEAHAAVLDGIEGGLTTGNALFRAQWIAEGQPLTAPVSEFGLWASARSGGGMTPGYPKGATENINNSSCSDVYRGVLQSGVRPDVEMGFTALDGTAPALESDIEDAVVGEPNLVILSSLVQGTPIANSTTCYYYYVGQYKNGTAANPVDIPYLVYNFTTGEVTRGTLPLNTD